tara:strand:- start:2450 stop:2941 length:492 start_codon:yes stop_codon:yes gene_type:complete
MSADSQNITSSEIYSKMGYAFLMFITDYYRRANEFGLNIDEVMVAQVVAAQFSYKLNQEKSKSFEEMKNLSNKDIQKAFQGTKLSILSIAEILGQPKESVRRRVQKLIDYQLLAKGKDGGIVLCENYTKVINSLSSGTNKSFQKLVKQMHEMGALKLFLEGGE